LRWYNDGVQVLKVLSLTLTLWRKQMLAKPKLFLDMDNVLVGSVAKFENQTRPL
jgi:hypothetical protein